jgi:hypothetical protein
MPSFFVLNLVVMPPQHMENFSRLLEMMQCQEHKPFAGTKCGQPLATKRGENTALVRELYNLIKD